MKCDTCGQDIKPSQDRHTDGNGSRHMACETHQSPPSDDMHKAYTARLSFFDGPKMRLYGEAWKE